MRAAAATRLWPRRLLRGRAPKILLVLFIILNILDVVHIHRDLTEGEKARYQLKPRPAQRLYVASMHFNDGKMLRSHWTKEIIRMSETFGKDNMFISVSESGSWDDSKPLLRGLDRELERRAIPRRVVVSDVSHKDEIEAKEKGEGWIDTPGGDRQLRRIPYLARLRNQVLEDLIQFAKEGVYFDKIIFLNDVVFKTEDVMMLMDTNGGQYAAACALDFSQPPYFYDTFALRDSDGHKSVMSTWPYFRSSRSRDAVVHNRDAVPVKSCWNGLVVMPAQPFVEEQLRFRAIPDSLAKHHLEGSECCLIHAENPLTKSLGVYLNPRVRVAYSQPAWDEVHPREKLWVDSFDIVKGLWKNRVKRWLSWGLENWAIRSRVGAWEKEDPVRNKEPGEFCLIDEMHVLSERGWLHL